MWKSKKNNLNSYRLKKKEGILNNLIVSLYINMLLKKGKQLNAEKVIYTGFRLYNLTLKQNSKFLFFKILQNGLSPLKTTSRDFHNKVQQTSLLSSFFSILKKNIKIISENANIVIKIKCYLFKFLIENINTLSFKSITYKKLNSNNQQFFLDKKYSNYYWV